VVGSQQLTTSAMAWPTYIINKSLIMGVYPERLKYAVIKPIYKKRR
jgi:hypothetical protein